MTRSALPSPHPLHAWTARDFWLALAAVMLFWAAAAAVWPLTGAVVPWDSKNHFYPMLRYLGAALANGELPLWNPYHFAGHPSVADPQSLLFTPTMLFFAWLDPSPSMELFDAVVFAHLIPGAVATLLLFRRRGWHPVGAVAAAMVFVLGGSASARLQHTGMIISYGFVPLAWWLLEEALARRSYAFGLAFAVVAAVMTVGRDQVAFLCGLSLIGVAVHAILTAPAPLSYLRARIGVLAAMGVVGGALLAVPSLLTMQFLMTSTRPSFGYGAAIMGSLPPSSFATALFADVFGSLRWTYDYWGPDWQSMDGNTWTDRAVNYLFAGTLPAVLILWHGIAGGRLAAREVRYPVIVLAAATLYALGRYTPVFAPIFDHFPGVDLYRRPADATFVVNIGLALAAGYLVHRYVMEGAPRLRSALPALRVALPALAVAGLGGILFVSYAYAAKAHHLPDALRDGLVGTGIALTAVAAMLWAGPRRRTLAAAGLVALLGAELVWRNAGNSLNAEPAGRYAVFQQLPPEQLQGLTALKAELDARHAKGEHPRVEILGLGGAWQNASMVLGLEDTIGYNPLRLADYERAVGPGENAADPNLRQFPGLFRGYCSRLASLLGLEYLVLDRPAERLPKHFPQLTGAKLLYGSGQMWIYRLDPAKPRAYLATRLVPVDSESVLDQDELPEFEGSETALVDRDSVPKIKGEFGLKDPAAPVVAAKGTATILAYRRNVVTVEVETDRDSVLVLHDIFYPGWQARVDGARRPILRTNLLFRGVEVPAGKHVVEFRFRPLSVDNLVAAASELLARDDDAGETAVR
ncbi:YfhO family protein [uncultured Methylobacterium sp.]|uniref:YfhO family protein n=1 Tax=uncultured Methylobacterium sp. TaxID=157278 RepID=UPI002599E4FE|nr:YfhO family protein [uncultured Methylobacterium sp.]